MEQVKQAYITIVSSEDYLEGVRILYYSMQKVKSAYPLYVLLSESIAHLRPKVEKWGLPVLVAKDISLGEFEAKNDRQYWNNTFFKLRIFELTQFEKLVYLDNDIILLKNLDHLFSCEHITAVQGGKLVYHWEDMSSGLMVLRPSVEEFHGLIDVIPIVCKRKIEENCGFGDQDILSYYYKNVHQVWPEEHRLDETYYGMVRCIHELAVHYGYRNMKVVHFSGEKKPWMFSFSAAVKYVCHYVLHHERYRAGYVLRYFVYVVLARIKYR